MNFIEILSGFKVLLRHENVSVHTKDENKDFIGVDYIEKEEKIHKNNFDNDENDNDTTWDERKVGEVVGGNLLSSSSMTASAHQDFSPSSLVIDDFPVNEVTESSTMTFQRARSLTDDGFDDSSVATASFCGSSVLVLSFNWQVLLLGLENFW